MFALAPERRTLPVDSATLLSVHVSFNQVSLAVPGRAAEQAQAYVVGYRAARGLCDVSVYILLNETATPVVYMHDAPAVSLQGFAAREQEALAFCESMGFMLQKHSELPANPPFLHAEPEARLVSAQEEALLEEVVGEELKPADLLGGLDAMSDEQRLAWCRFLAAF